jgi:hypothetical protein
MGIGTIEKVELREIWSHEAVKFTPWLEENIEILGEVIVLQLSFVEREKTIGTFSLDLLAEDADRNKVVIENQLETTDHKHLGQVLVYMIGLDAKTAIWVCRDARQEHIKVINWLNEITPADMLFYLIKVEGIKIDDSLPAPLFSVICAPSDDVKEIGRNKEEFAERHKLRLEFWRTLLDKSKKKTTLHAIVSPSKENYIKAGAGISGLSYTYSITMNSASVELSIDTGGKNAEEVNKKIFYKLQNNKNAIENKFRMPLVWDYVEGRKSCRIKWETKKSGLKETDKWDELQDEMIDTMIKLQEAFKDDIEKLKV